MTLTEQVAQVVKVLQEWSEDSGYAIPGDALAQVVRLCEHASHRPPPLLLSLAKEVLEVQVSPEAKAKMSLVVDLLEIYMEQSNG